MEYPVGQYRVTCCVRPSLQVRPFTAPLLRNLKGLLVTLAAVVIIINRGLFLHSIPTVSSVSLQRLGVTSFGVDAVCKIRSQIQKDAAT